MDLRLYNKSDMTATFSMLVPLKMEAGIEVQIEPRDGTVEPRGEATLQVFVIPTRKGEVAEQTVQVCVGDIIQPLALKVSANVFGVEVDYAIIPVGEPFPIIENAPRKPDDPPNVGTHQVLQGRAPRNAPTIDFGEMPLLSSKSMQVVLYNRSGIPAPYAVSVAKNPAYVPNLKGRKIGGLLEAATKMYCLRPQAGTDDGATSFGPETFANEPMPAASGKAPDGATTGGRKDSRRSSTASHQRGSRTSTRAVARKNSHLKSRRSADGGNSTQKTTASRRFLLDDKHEAQAFRSSFGGEFAKQKEQHQQYTIALKEGRGWAVRVEPSSDWLQPFLYSVITLTCYSDLPGVMEDELIVKIPHLAGHEEGNAFRIPMKLVSVGNPLSLPEEQVGLCATEDPPRLLCGTIVPSEMRATRRFKVANSSAAPMKITWKVYPKVQLESMKSERQFLNIALCRKGDTDPFEDTIDVFRPSFDDDPALDAAEGLQEEEDRPYQFNLWAGEPPTVTDPLALQSTDDMPMRVEPEQGVVPIHGTATFTVTLTASKAMPTAAGHYHYVLVGKGRFTEERETYLAQLGASSSEPSRFLEPVQPVPKVKEEVGDLPRLRLDEDELLDSDSDQEGLPPPRTRPDSEQSNAPRPAAPLSEPQVAVAADTTTRLPGEPDKDVLSTIVIDCIGDCIVPRLTIDKKAHPGVKEFQAHGSDSDGEKEPMNCPVFKFIHSTVMPVHLDGPAPRSQQPLGTQGAPPGTPFDAVATQYPQQLDVHGPALRNQPLGMTLGAPLGSSPCDGVVSHLMREVSMTNSNACVVTCRFRVQGPFQIREITQVGRHPVRKPTQSKMRTKRVRHQEDPQEQPPTELFKVGKLETITLQIEFAPDLVPASWWTDHKPEHHFPGDLIIEYPSDITKDIDDARMDLQRVHLVAISRRPALKVALLPNSLDAPKSERPELVQQPTWFGKPAVLVEFGHVHVESSISRTRTIFITNETNVVAYWRIMHVGRKRRGPHDTNVPPDDEEFRALDDKDCFHFDVNQGTLLGPSKGAIPIDPKGERYRPRGTPERIPYLMPEMGPLHTKYQPKTEEHRYEPQRIRIDFKPVKNELYKSRFRVQVEKGLSVDFICRGCGSYDEEDDAIDMPMAQ